MTKDPASRRTPPAPAGRVALLAAIAVAAFLFGRWSVSPVAVSPPRANAARPPAATAAPPAVAPDQSAATSSALAMPDRWDEAEWIRVRSQPGSPDRTARLAAWLETLARTDPARALALAGAEKNLIVRASLLDAVLRGWADAAPADAAQWALALGDPAGRGHALETIFSRVAAQAPAEAVRLGRTVLEQDPGGATGHACALARALCSAGQFELAAQFAASPGELGVVGRSILLAQTYAAWSLLQPEAAAAAATALSDPALRTDALAAIVSGWGQADPAGLTRFAAQLPAGPDRVPLLGQALRQWANIDPPAATAWVTGHEAELGADEDVAALVSAGGFLPPEVAAEWADGIASPALRSQTVLHLLRDWALTAPAEAKRYFERTTALGEADRRQAAEWFTAPTDR
jgi:hypothetical protein